MAWIFTNTITALPFYQLKAEIISDAGTGTLNATNGGYFASIGEIRKELDEGTGAYRPGEVSLGLKNVGNVFSANVFTLDTNNTVEFRLWVSYDAGVTWENIFFGVISMKDWTYSDVDNTETQMRVYNCRAYSMFLSLKDVEVDFSSNPISSNIETAPMYVYRTDEAGSPSIFNLPFGTGNPQNFDFVQIREVLNYICQGLQFVGGTTRPTITINTAALTHQGLDLDTNTAYSFNDLYLHYTNQRQDLVNQGFLASFFMSQAGKSSAYDAKNYQELLKRFCEFLLVVPTAVLTESGGAYTCTVTFRPRFFYSVADVPAISGTLSTHYSRGFHIGQWFDGAQCSTLGLPYQNQLGASSSSNVVEIRQFFCTSPFIQIGTATITPYTFAEAAIIDQFSGERMTTRSLPAQMIYAKVADNQMANINKFRHDSRAAFEETTQSGYYGVQISAFNFISLWDVRSRSQGIGRRGFNIMYRGLKGSTIADLELSKKVTIGTLTYIITGISRDVSQNTTTLTLLEIK